MTTGSEGINFIGTDHPNNGTQCDVHLCKHNGAVMVRLMKRSGISQGNQNFQL